MHVLVKALLDLGLELGNLILQLLEVLPTIGLRGDDSLLLLDDSEEPICHSEQDVTIFVVDLGYHGMKVVQVLCHLLEGDIDHLVLGQ